MKNALEIVRQRTRSLYQMYRPDTPSAILYLNDIRTLVEEDRDFTFHDRNGEWSEDQLLTRVIIRAEDKVKCKDTALLTRIIREGSAVDYIKKLELRNKLTSQLA